MSLEEVNYIISILEKNKHFKKMLDQNDSELETIHEIATEYDKSYLQSFNNIKDIGKIRINIDNNQDLAKLVKDFYKFLQIPNDILDKVYHNIFISSNQERARFSNGKIYLGLNDGTFDYIKTVVHEVAHSIRYYSQKKATNTGIIAEVESKAVENIFYKYLIEKDIKIIKTSNNELRSLTYEDVRKQKLHEIEFEKTFIKRALEEYELIKVLRENLSNHGSYKFTQSSFEKAVNIYGAEKINNIRFLKDNYFSSNPFVYVEGYDLENGRHISNEFRFVYARLITEYIDNTFFQDNFGKYLLSNNITTPEDVMSYFKINNLDDLVTNQINKYNLESQIQLTSEIEKNSNASKIDADIFDQRSQSEIQMDSSQKDSLKKNNFENDIIDSLQKLKQLSKLSTRQMLELYSNDSKYSGIVETIQKQKMELLQQVKQEREQFEPRIIEHLKKSLPALSEQTISKLADEQFYRMSISKFLKPVISQVEKEYGTIIPEDKMEKFKGLADFKNIKLNFNGTNAEADSKNGQLIFNPNETSGTTIEEKIVMSMGVSIHEAFHLLVNMNKSQEQAMEDSERLKYIVSTSEGDKEVHFAPGKYGQVLNEGFVEKMSSEFAQRNRFYCMINPRYIPYVEVCSKIMEHDNSITPQVLFTKNADAIREKMNHDIRTKYEEAERIAVINHFSVKEADKDSSLKNITSDNVKESWMEKKGVDLPKTKNDMFKETLEIKREKQKENNNIENSHVQEKKNEKITSSISVKRGEEVKSVSFTRRSEAEIQIANQIKQKNIIIKQQKEQQRNLQKPKVKTLTKKSSNGGSSTSGFANILSLTLITSLIGCAIIMVVFIILK